MDTTNFVFNAPVAITDPNSHADALKIISRSEQVNPIAREEFDAKYRGDYELKQIKPEAGLILINGNTQGALVYEDSAYPRDPAMALAVVFNLSVQNKVVVPSVHGVVAGEEFQGVLKFRRNRETCCPKTKDAMSALVLLEHGGSIKWAERHTTFTRDTCKDLFQKSAGGVVQDNKLMQSILEQAYAYTLVATPAMRVASSLVAAPK